MNELFAVEVVGNYIRLVPVKVEPRYSADEIKAIDRIVEKEKGRAKVFNSGKDFSGYIKKIAK